MGRAQAALHYLEGWTDKGSFVTHRGKVGTVGTTTRRAIQRAKRPTSPSLAEHVAGLRARADELGYREFGADEHALVVLQVWTHTDDLSHDDDARLLPGLIDGLDEYLGWRGVGHCDGNDIGGVRPDGVAGGTVVNVFCPVVDAEIGVRLLRRFAREYPVPQRHVIGVRPPGPDEFTLAYSPRKSDTAFRL